MAVSSLVGILCSSNVLKAGKCFVTIPKLLTCLFFFVVVAFSSMTARCDEAQVLLTEEELVWLKKHPRLTFSTGDSYAPVTYRDRTGNLIGLTVDYARLIESKLGVKIDFYSAQWKEALGKAMSHETDGVLHANITEERKKSLAFSEVFFVSPFALVTSRESPEVESLDDLVGKKIAMKESNVAVDFFRNQYPKVAIIETESLLEALKLVSEGKVFGAFEELSVANYEIKKYLLSDLKFALVHYDENVGHARIGVRNNAPELLSAVNKAIRAISEDEHQAIRTKWLGRAVAKQDHKVLLHLTQEEQAWIRNHPTVYLAAESIEPYSFLENGEPTGYSIELVKAICAEVGLKLDLSIIPLQESLERMKRGESDLNLNLVYTDDRAAYMLYSNESVELQMGIFARNDRFDISDLESLQGKTIVSYKGSFLLSIMKEALPDSRFILAENNSAKYRMVASGQADAAIGEISSVEYRLTRYFINNVELKGIAKLFGEKPLRMYGYAIRKDLPLLKSILGKGSRALGTGKKQRIWKHWFAGKSESDKIILTIEEKAWIKAHPEIVLGTDQDWQPYVIAKDDGSAAGVEADLIERINQLAETNIRITLGKWPEMVKKARNRKIDGLLLSTFHKEREPYFFFTDSPYRMPKYIYTRKASFAKLKRMEDLTGKKVAFLINNRAEVKLLQRSPGIILVHSANTDEMISMLLAGEVDAVIAGINFRIRILERVISDIDIAFIVPDSEVDILYSIRKDWPELHSIINKALAAIPLNERLEILEKWSAQYREKEIAPNLGLTVEEKRWLDTHPVIRVGSDPDWAPIEFMGKDGKFNGIAVDYLSRVEELTGVRFDIDRQSSWQELIKKAKDRDIDLFSCVTITNERSSYLGFTQPYLSFPIVVFTRMDMGYVNDLQDLQDQKIAVVESYAIHELLKRDHPNLQLVPVKSIREGLQKLKSGIVAAFVGNMLTTTHNISKHAFAGLKVAGETPYQNDLAMGVRSDWPELVGILQKALDNISEEEKKSFHRKWVSLTYEHKFDYTILWKLLIVFLVAFGAFFFWNRRLASEVRKRKEAQTELALYHEQLENLVDERTEELSKEVDDHKTAVEEKLKLESQLRQTQKMESIGTLAGGIAHDFNNILTAILGYGDMVLDELPKDSELRIQQEQVLKAGNRAKDLVKQILAFSRQTEQELMLIQPHIIIKEALKLLRASIPTTIEISENIQKCGMVEADPTQLHQIIMNLCTNAYHAMRDTGGVLAISLQAVEIKEDDDKLASLELNPATYLKIEVSDTGHGMDKKTMEKIFDPYFTTKKKGEGTGLGLAVVHGIVKSYRGHVSIYSEPSQGTTFHVYLPKAASEVDVAKEKVSAAIPTGTEHILLVDDDNSLLEMECKMLKHLGYQVTSFTSSLEALREFEKQPEKFALVITDMTMPNMTGAELAKQLHALKQYVPVILCTGFSALINEEKAKALGISKYLLKPIIKRDLATAIRDILDKKAL